MGRGADQEEVARDPGAHLQLSAVSHGPYRRLCAHRITGGGRARQHKAAANSERTIPALSADYRFIGGEMAANESRVLLMVDTETSMVFAHVCKRKGADPHIFEALVLDIEVQENPVKAAQREFAATTRNEAGEWSPK